MRDNLKSKLRSNFRKFEKRLPLEKFIPSAFLLFLLCILILSLITYKNIQDYRNQTFWVNNANEIKSGIKDIHIHIRNLPLLRRSYLNSNDEFLLTKYDSLKHSVRNQLDDFRQLIFNDPAQVSYLDQIDLLYKENNRLIDSSMSMRIAGNLSEEDQLEISKLIQANIEEVNLLADQIEKNESLKLDLLKREADDTSSYLLIFIIGTSIFSFVVIGLSLLISDKLIKNKNSAEKLLQESYEELENKVDERTSELKKSNELLKGEIKFRSKMEVTLRESEQRFRSMADSAPVLIWIADENRHCTYFNTTWLEFTGKSMEHELVSGWTGGIHPDDYSRCMNVYENAFSKRSPFEIEFRLKSADSSYRWILNKGVPRYEGDEFVGFIGSCIDINQIKKNESFLKIQFKISKTLEEAKSKEEAISGALKNICSGINWHFGVLWTIDESQNFLKVESIWDEDIASVNEYSEMYDRFYKFPKNEGLPGAVIKGKKSIWIKDIRFDESFIRKEAALTMGWNSVLGIPISNGREVIAIIECFNKKIVSERADLIEMLESAGRQIGNYLEKVSAEEKLRNSNLELEAKVKDRTVELATTLTKLLKEIEEKEIIQNKIRLFEHAIKSIGECVFITDLNFHTLFVNSAFENTFKYFENDIISKELPIISREKISASLRSDIINSTLKGGWKGEIETLCDDGTLVYSYLSTSSIRNEEGRIKAIVGICQDISEIKKAEEIISKRNSHLNLLNDIIHFTNKSSDLNESIKYSINKVCENTQWDVGHCFLMNADELYPSNIWNENLGEEFRTMKRETEDTTFSIGEGEPGHIYKTGKAIWITSENNNDGFTNAKSRLSQQSGLKTGVWVPIATQNNIYGVFEFFKKATTPRDNELLNCLVNVGIELGSLIERLKSTDKLKESEKILIQAQHIAKLGNWGWDVEKNVVEWSDEMYSIYEMNPEDFAPDFDGFLKRIHPEDRIRVKEVIMNAFKSKEPFNFFHRIVTPEGKIKFLKAQGEIYLDNSGNVVKMFGTGHDVTDIREAEENLKKSESKLREAQKIARLGTWEWNVVTNKVTFSEETCNIYELEYQNGEFEGEEIGKMFHEDDIEIVKEARNKLLNENVRPDLIYRIITKSGKVKYLKSLASTLTNENGKLENVSGIVMDITDIKLVEEELRNANYKLVQTQKELIHNEKLAALGRFSSGIAHEIRNPLANISSLAQMLMNTELEEKNKKRLKYILANSDIANNIIKNLLSFASPEDLKFRDENIRNVLNGIIEVSEARAKEKNINIIKDLPENLPTVAIDKFKIENAFMNFISNSIDAMPDGGDLTVRASQKNGNNHEVVIDFIDTGFGISQENLDKILEPFFTTKNNGVGLGMGLAYNTIKAHNGVFLLNSTEGVGTHIQIHLPVSNNSK